MRYVMMVGLIAVLAGCIQVDSRHVAPEMAAIVHMRSIAAAEQAFREVNGRYGSIDELPAATRKGGYRFQVSLANSSFEVHAEPERWGRDGRRTFLMTEGYEIHERWASSPATLDDEVMR